MSDFNIVPIPERIPDPITPKLSRVAGLEDLWKIFVRLRGDLMPNTLDEYAVIGRRFCRYMQGKALEPKVMMEWVLFLQDHSRTTRAGTIKLSPTHINKVNVRVKSFLRWLKTMGYTSYDLADAIPTLQAPALKESLAFTEEEYEKIKAYCKGRQWCQAHLWLCILAYRTGMSLVDCCYLRWRDVHMNQNSPSYIDIYRIKTKRLGGKALCQIPLIPGTDVWIWLEHLKKQEHLNYKRHDGITDFVHQDAPGLYECEFSRIHQDFRNIFSRAGIEPGKTFRHFRNSFCSNLVNSNTNIALVCKMTGHNNVKTLLRYLKVDRRALADGLARAFGFAANVSGTGKGEDGIIKFGDITQ